MKRIYASQSSFGYIKRIFEFLEKGKKASDLMKKIMDKERLRIILVENRRIIQNFIGKETICYEPLIEELVNNF